MGKKLKLVSRFLTDQEYRENLPLMKWIGKKASFWSQHTWTSIRFPGGIIVIFATNYNPWLGFASIVFFALSDGLDGLVARHKKEQNGRFGALLDATADKSFATPILSYWGYLLSPTFIFYFELTVLILIESSNLFLRKMEKRGIVKSEILYEHLLSGKFKFAFQIILIGMLWMANFIFPNHPMIWIPLFHLLIGMIIVLAFKSVFGKINRIRALTSK